MLNEFIEFPPGGGQLCKERLSVEVRFGPGSKCFNSFITNLVGVKPNEAEYFGVHLLAIFLLIDQAGCLGQLHHLVLVRLGQLLESPPVEEGVLHELLQAPVVTLAVPVLINVDGQDVKRFQSHLIKMILAGLVGSESEREGDVLADETADQTPCFIAHFEPLGQRF